MVSHLFLPRRFDDILTTYIDYETLLALDEMGPTPTQIFSAASPEQISRLPTQTVDSATLSKEPLVTTPDICN